MKRKSDKKNHSRKLIILAVIMVVVFLGYAGNLFIGERRLSFQEYQPTQLPLGITVTSHRVGISRAVPGQHYKTLSYSTNNSNFHIGEQKSSPVDFANRTSSCNFHVTNATCTERTTSQGQRYSDSVAYSPDLGGKAFSQTISFLKDGTYIWINLDEDQVQKYTTADWDALINSFTPVS